MNVVIVDKKVAYDPLRDGISTYHQNLFHGTVVNEEVDDNNPGDPLTNPLQLEKNVYDCCYILQPQRNLILPESAKKQAGPIFKHRVFSCRL